MYLKIDTSYFLYWFN